MKPNTPWSVKGIDPEAREAAKVAARRSGMTLGEWLNSLILQSGELPEGYSAELADQESEDVDNGDSVYGSDSEPIDELQERLESLNRRLDQSERNRTVAVSGIDQSIERLASTIETSRRLMASGDVAPKSAVNEIAARLERLQARLEEVASQKRTGIDPNTLMALERAIAGVASHIEKSDRRNTELVQSVEDALGQVDARIEGAEETVNTAASRIDLALDRLSGRIDSAEGEHRRTSARFNERLSQIDERISTVATDRDSTIAALERRLSGFETRLQNAQSRIEAAALARSNLPPDAVSRSELEEWSRRQASDQGAEIAALKRSVGTVESRLGTLVERLDHMREDTAAHVRDVERKAEEAEAAARSAAEAPPQRDEEAAQSITEIRSSVADIATRFEHANQTATETMSALEGVLRSLTRRLDSLEGRQGRAAAEAPMLPAAPKVMPPEEPEAFEAEAEPELPKRPSWSWGIAQRRAEPEEAEQEEETIGAASAEASEAEIAEDELQRQESLHAAGAADEVFEIVAQAGETHHAEDVSEEPEAVEATFTPEDERTFETMDGTHGGEPGETDEEPEGSVDLSKLVFDLGDARERAPEPDGWQRGTDEHVVEELPSDSTVEAREEGGWLEQARRAAKAASPSDRVSDFAPYEEENSARRGILIALVVVIALGVVGALAWFVGRPWLAAHNRAAVAPQATTAQPARPPAKPQATPGERAPISPGAPAKAPAQNAATMPPTNGADGAPAATSSKESKAAQPSSSPAAASAAASGVAAPAQAATAAPTATPAPDSAAAAKQAMEAAANSGNSHAQYALALDYKNGGDGLAADPAKALDWMKKASDQGLAAAQRTLGSWYEQGDGVPKDLTKARSWYERAAQNGDVQAMHNLGFFYAEGEGGLTKNAAQAEKWFKSAAETGLTDSQVNLAIIYSQGNTFGVKPQMDKAYLWASIASARRPGDADAKKLRAAIASALPADEKAKIDKQVADWKPQPVDIAANGGFDTSPDAYLPADRQPALSRSDVATVQDNLNQLGFNAGTADGRIGPQTVAAIKRFQAAYHLPPTGEANGALLAALGAVPR